MKRLAKIIFLTGGIILLAGCTPRRDSSKPEADGDTIEVVISTPDAPVNHTPVTSPKP